MKFGALFGIILFILLMPNSFAADKFNDKSPPIPGEGLVAEGNKEWQKAISIYLNQLLQNPYQASLWLRIAVIEHQLKNYSLAINAYQQAIILQPDNAKLHKTLSEIYAEIKQPALALAEINKAVKLQPNNIEYLAARASIANWNNARQIVLDSDQRMLFLIKNQNLAYDQFELLTQIGNIQYQLQHYTDAIIAYNQALQIKPNNASIYVKLSQIYSAEKQPNNALVAIDKAFQLEPNNIQHLQSKAILETWLKNYTVALETYQKILKLSPQNKIAIKGLAFVEHLIQTSKKMNETVQLSPFDQLINQVNNEASAHHYQLAAIAMKKAIAIRPNSPDLYRKLSEIYAMAQQPRLALAANSKAVKLAPNNIDYWRAQGKLASWAGDKAETLLSYQRILTLKPYDQDAMLKLGHTLAWQGKVDEAIEAYQQLLKVYPNCAEGWLEYAEVLSWTGNFIGSNDALNQYKQLKGETTQYLETHARIFALAGWYQSALTINDPLLNDQPDDSYLLSTEVTALTKSFQTDKAMYYLNKLNKISPDDAQARGTKNINYTPIRSNINFEADYTAATDTTRIADIPIYGQYFLNPHTSLLFQGLFERAAAASTSPLKAVNGNTFISDESAKVGASTQYKTVNIKGLLGGLKIEGGNNHLIYDASMNTNFGEKAQVSIGSVRDLFRPYLVPQSPKLISLQVIETRIGGFLQWQPAIQKYLNILMSYSTLSDDNDYTHYNIWPKARVFASEKWLVTVGVDGDFWHFRRRATDGYYSPILFTGYEGTVELYYAKTENIGFGFSGGFGLQKDETFPHYFYEEDLAMQLFFGIFSDWELRVRSGFTLRDNPTKRNYRCWSANLILTRRY